MKTTKTELTLDLNLNLQKLRSPRWTQRRFNTFNQLRLSIAGAYVQTVKTCEPITMTFKRVLKTITDADVTATQRKTLHDTLWATRMFVVVEHARWQLYIKTPESVRGLPTCVQVVNYKGVYWTPLTSEEISALREAGDEDIWLRVHGRMEWRDSQKPFYEDEPPSLLRIAESEDDSTLPGEREVFLSAKENLQ